MLPIKLAASARTMTTKDDIFTTFDAKAALLIFTRNDRLPMFVEWTE
jgi:hypothetical protein